jgi:hypothetical protein
METSEARYLMSLAVTIVPLITTKSNLGAMFPNIWPMPN